MSVCPPICLSFWLSACLSAYLSVRLSVCLSACLSAYLSVCLPACLSVRLPVCPLACLSVRLPVVSVRLSICPPVNLYYLLVCLFACLPACLFVCRSADYEKLRLRNCKIAVADQDFLKKLRNCVCGRTSFKLRIWDCGPKKSCACTPPVFIHFCGVKFRMKVFSLPFYGKSYGRIFEVNF